jgi:acetyl esterase/lipase
MDPPRTEAAFAAALPLAGLDAWRIYLGLPMTGARLPAGGAEEVMRLGYEDAVLNLQGPIAAQGAEEFPAAWADLRGRLGLAAAPVALVGGSMGSAVAGLVLTGTGPDADLRPAAAVLISPIVQLRPVVDAAARQYGFEYTWGPASLEVAARLDLVARADDLVRAGQPAVLTVVGADDDADGVLLPARRLHASLAERYDDASRTAVEVIPGMAHALAEEPGEDPAPQTPAARAVDLRAVQWLRRHLAIGSQPAGLRTALPG